MGLSSGPVPPRVHADVKAGLLALVDHATAAGWSTRRAAATLGIDHTRVLRWRARAAADRLEDAKPGLDTPLHALLDWEREAIVKLAEEWGPTTPFFIRPHAPGRLAGSTTFGVTARRIGVVPLRWFR